MLATEWNSLEIAKLSAAVLTPILLLFLGLVIKRASQRLAEVQWSNRKFMERRLDVYDEMAPKLNDLYCFFRCIGGFREVTPPDALERKRELDRAFYVNEFLFTTEFRKSYQHFINTCFSCYSGNAEDAKLRASLDKQRLQRGTKWRDDWTSYFSPRGEMSSSHEVTERYTALMMTFAHQVQDATP